MIIMKKSLKLSESELEVLQALWECEAPTKPSVLLDLLNGKDHEWSISTVQTLLSRLYEKNAVDFLVEKRFRYYYPKISKNDYVLNETGCLIDQIGASSPVSLMAGLLGTAKLSANEIVEIERLLERAKRDIKDD